MYTARCTRCSHTQPEKENAQRTALPYRTVLARWCVLVMVSLLLLSQTSQGAFLVGAPAGLPRSRCTCTLQGPGKEPHTGPGEILEGSPLLFFFFIAVAVAFVALPDSIGSQYCKLHARRGTHAGPN